MSKIVMLKLRNRILNRFKQQKKTLAKKIGSKKITKGKTLRVVVVQAKQQPVKQISKPVSPVGKISPQPKIGARTVNALIGHRRLFLRNRRLMGCGSPRAAITVC